MTRTLVNDYADGHTTSQAFVSTLRNMKSNLLADLKVLDICFQDIILLNPVKLNYTYLGPSRLVSSQKTEMENIY